MRTRWIGDLLAVVSAVTFAAPFLMMIPLAAVTFLSPSAIPRIPDFLKSHWYTIPFLGVPFTSALWVWMLVHAIKELKHPRSQDALVWLIVLLAGMPLAAVYYFAQYRPRLGGRQQR